MTLWMLRKFFGVFIGRFPEADRERYWAAFESLMGTIVREGVKGAIKGAKDK